MLAYALFPGIPLTLAISAGVLGICLVVIRDGWLSLFIAAVVTCFSYLFTGMFLSALPYSELLSLKGRMVNEPRRLT